MSSTVQTADRIHVACVTCRRRHIKCVPAKKHTERRSCVTCLRKNIICEYLEVGEEQARSVPRPRHAAPLPLKLPIAFEFLGAHEPRNSHPLTASLHGGRPETLPKSGSLSRNTRNSHAQAPRFTPYQHMSSRQQSPSPTYQLHFDELSYGGVHSTLNLDSPVAEDTARISSFSRSRNNSRASSLDSCYSEASALSLASMYTGATSPWDSPSPQCPAVNWELTWPVGAYPHYEPPSIYGDHDGYLA
ncbi:Zn(2)-C6 fungal-type domain-containing protein [Mycena indigotica]|uniref:Zn(2)-C6 fungal-type domain-containing protein n=1 Tax=Mycena indigotica TaxID=2126181 RepID=A0A8H6S0U5_9AGAR|nr:Zn(2)-C6 fungal-type domain-containing protein [Mycena indigotica]KAF7290839.1 Zn(2)-C6 fungal-type domain-containing protein [Mycena indigotica]